MNIKLLRTAVCVAALAGVALWHNSANAADKVKVAKAGQALVFSVADVGNAAGIWKKVGLEVQTIQMEGEAPMEKAFASGDLDFALASGTSGAFHIKGVPQTPVAALYGEPYDFVVIVAPTSKVQKLEELKGKKLGVTARGSLTDWMVHEASRQAGWGDDGIESVGISSLQARIAAMKNGDIDGMITTPENAADLEEHNAARTVFSFGDKVKNFMTHSILASNEMIEKKPDVVKRFLKGWFMTVAYVKDPKNKDLSVKTISEALKMSPTAISKAFDIDLKGFSSDGAFIPAQVDTVRKSLPGFGLLDRVPEPKELYNYSFVPVKLN